MCGFSSRIGNGVCNSKANESSGDSVPEVSNRQRGACSARSRIAMPALKHLYFVGAVEKNTRDSCSSASDCLVANVHPKNRGKTQVHKSTIIAA